MDGLASINWTTVLMLIFWFYGLIITAIFIYFMKDRGRLVRKDTDLNLKLIDKGRKIDELNELLKVAEEKKNEPITIKQLWVSPEYKTFKVKASAPIPSYVPVGLISEIRQSTLDTLIDQGKRSIIDQMTDAGAIKIDIENGEDPLNMEEIINVRMTVLANTKWDGIMDTDSQF